MKWRVFEEECVEYLKEKYGNFFELKGEADSTVSDILFFDKRKKFYIEAKMSIAQCGQFVLLPNLKEKKFVYSSKNKTFENEYAEEIEKFMNKRFDEFYNSGTSGKELEISKSIFYNWIINYYKNKGVEYFITKDKNKFIIFHIDKFPNYFDVIAKYREKKSGSSKFTNSNKEDFEEAIKSLGIEYSFDGLDIISDSDLNDLKIRGNKYNYLLKKNNRKYIIRKLSNTRNANVIFSIKLMKYSDNEQKNDQEEFEETISNK